ncbi:MAG: integrase, partial [Spiribacter salinus]
KRMGVDAVPHGFRSSFKDWARNRTAFADEVSELALAHVSTDATRAAYARDELLPQRAKLMQAWAKFLREGEPAGEVVGIGDAAR